MTRAWWFLLAVLALAVGCGGGSPSVPTADRARAFQVAQEAELIGGPKATGRVGDFMLVNTKVRFVIAAAGRTRAWFPVGGCLLDADRVRDGAGEDRLQEMTTRLGAIRVLQAESVEVANDGADGKAAVVRVTGYDVGVPILQDVMQLPKANVLAAPAHDTWYVVIVDGDTAMDPVLPGKRPRSVTNAIFVDRDGNGAFDAPGL